MIHLCTEGGKDPQIWKSFKLNYTILGPNLGFSDLRCGDWSWYVYYNPRIGAEVSVFRSKRHYLGRSYWEQVGLFVPKNSAESWFWSCCFMLFKWISDLDWLTLNMHFWDSPRSCSTAPASGTKTPGWGGGRGGRGPRSLLSSAARTQNSSSSEILSSSPGWEALLFQNPFLLFTIL